MHVSSSIFTSGPDGRAGGLMTGVVDFGSLDPCTKTACQVASTCWTALSQSSSFCQPEPSIRALLVVVASFFHSEASRVLPSLSAVASVEALPAPSLVASRRSLSPRRGCRGEVVCLSATACVLRALSFLGVFWFLAVDGVRSIRLLLFRPLVRSHVTFCCVASQSQNPARVPAGCHTLGTKSKTLFVHTACKSVRGYTSIRL